MNGRFTIEMTEDTLRAKIWCATLVLMASGLVVSS